MKGSKEKGDGDIRHDFPGGWPNEKTSAFIKAGRTTEQQQYFDYTSKLFNWRKSNEAIHYGKTTQYVPENNVYVYFRYTTNKTVMVIINNSTDNSTLNTSRFAENIKNYKSGKDVVSGKTLNLNELAIDGTSALILELQ
jgi:glycosidase